jgi:hypothetical protein
MGDLRTTGIVFSDHTSPGAPREIRKPRESKFTQEEVRSWALGRRGRPVSPFLAHRPVLKPREEFGLVVQAEATRRGLGFLQQSHAGETTPGEIDSPASSEVMVLHHLESG